MVSYPQGTHKADATTTVWDFLSCCYRHYPTGFISSFKGVRRRLLDGKDCRSLQEGVRDYGSFRVRIDGHFTPDQLLIYCTINRSCSITIPQLHGRSHKELAKRCQSSRPLGIFRSGNDEFFLCYDSKNLNGPRYLNPYAHHYFTEFGLYVNRYGDLNPTKGTIEWEIIADHVAYHPPYVLVFNACFIEVRHIESGRLCQIISGRSLQCTWNGYGSSVPLSRPDSGGTWGEIPAHGTSVYGVMRTGDWSHEPHIAGAVSQSVFELVPTVFYLPVEEVSLPARS
jgi:CNH domain-containing protein